MNYLYVCHFSNGHIKVGRSVDPLSRIAAHEARVSCMGVALVEYATFACVGSSIPAEADLIARCVEQASARHKNEWFTGLCFLDVSAWAEVCSMASYPDTEPAVSAIRLAFDSAGSMTAAASSLGMSVQRLSNWISRNNVPLTHCARLEEVTGGAVMRWDMRPDDWHFIWPELKERADAPEIVPNKQEA